MKINMRRDWGAGEGKILLNCSGGTVNWLDFFRAHFFVRKKYHGRKSRVVVV
jgi:hypothetical protein